jgi:hypothetical protein
VLSIVHAESQLSSFNWANFRQAGQVHYDASGNGFEFAEESKAAWGTSKAMAK